MEEADTLQHASQDSPRLQHPHMGFLGLGADPYLPKATELYDDPNVLIPTKSDTIEEILAKAQRVGNVLEEGASLALSTNKLLTQNGFKTPEQVALSYMSVEERGHFEHWKKDDYSLPPIDYDKSRTPSASMGGKRTSDRNTRREIMRRLYKQDNLGEEHYLWFVTTYVYLVPLINAVKKLIKAERNANSGNESITSLDLEEFQTINKLVSVFGSRQKEISKYKVGFVNRAIHRVISLATERRESIKSSRKEGNTQNATNKARDLFLGKRDKRSDYIQKGQALRLPRSSG